MKYSLRSLMIAVAIRFAFLMPPLLAGVYLLATDSRWGARVFWGAEFIFICLLGAYWAWASVYNAPAPRPLRSNPHERFSRIWFWLLMAMTAGVVATAVWAGFNPDTMETLRRPLKFSAPVTNPPAK